MTTQRITTVLISVGLAVAGATAAVAPAVAAQPGDSSITARTPNPTPAVGEEFVVKGTYVFAGSPAAGHHVKVQTFRDHRWMNLEGARVTAATDGDYRVRVILLIRGVRDLRVVGLSGSAAPNSYDRLVVQVSRH